jgi:hypothetical protein
MKNFKKVSFLVLVGALVSGASFAQTGPNTSVDCGKIAAQIKAKKAKEGAAAEAAPAEEVKEKKSTDVR